MCINDIMKIRGIPKQAQVNALEKHSVGSISYAIMLHKHTFKKLQKCLCIQRYEFILLLPVAITSYILYTILYYSCVHKISI